MFVCLSKNIYYTKYIFICVKDICIALDIKNTTDTIRRLNSNDIDELDSIDVVGKRAKMKFVNEPGMYLLVLSSRKEIAKQLADWLAHSVIPSIRKTGSYIAGNDMPELLQNINNLQEQLSQTKSELANTKLQLTTLEKRHQALKKQRCRYQFMKDPSFYILIDNWREGTPKNKVGTSANVNIRLAGYRTYMPDLKIQYMCFVESIKEAEFVEEAVLRKFNGSYNPKDSEYICNTDTESIINYVRKVLEDSNIKYKEEANIDKYNLDIDPMQPITTSC